MRGRSGCSLALMLVVAAAAHADVLVNDRSDAVGPNQFGARVTTVYNNGTIGTMPVVMWSVYPNAAGFRFAVAPLNSLAFTQGGSPPAPAGWQWMLDPVVHGAANDEDGFFYVAGSVRQPGLPLTTGLAFVRGRVDLPGSVSFDPPQLLANYGTTSGNTVFFGVTDMQVHPADGSIYVLYNPSLSGGTPRNFYCIRSGNGGASWSNPVRVSPDSSGGLAAPSIVCNDAAGDITVLWHQTTANGRVVWSSRSTNFALSFGAPVSAMTFPPLSGRPPSRGGDFLASVTRDRWGSVPNSLVYGATIPPDLEHDTYPSVASAPAVSEVEPNNSFLSANPASPSGVVLRGTISAASDTDQFAFDLVQGQEVNAWDDSVAASPFFLQLEWVGPDGVSVLTSTSVGVFYSEQHFGFVAPATARYYLRVRGFNTTAPYRLRTVWGSTPYPGASDQRDVAFSLLPPGGSWTGTQSIAPADPLGYDATCLSLGAALDGAVYAAYDDFSVLPGRALMRRVIRRSTDAGATWSAPAAISTVNTDWATTSGFELDRCDISVLDGINILNVWTDGRNGDPDVYLDRIERRIYVTSTDPFVAIARPGETVHARRDVRNADHAESFPVRMLPDGSAYGWTLATSDASLAPGATASLDCVFQVPANAAPGDYTVTIFYRSVNAPSGATYGIAPLALHVTQNTGVDSNGPAVLALAPIQPNPLTGPADVRFSLARAGRAKLAIVGIDGRVVRTLLDQDRAAGPQHVTWDGRDASGSRVAPGEYFVVLKAEGRRLTRRIVELR